MAYTPTTWTTGDTITASSMNKIENGISDAGEKGIDAVIWFPNSTVGYQIYGDFEKALAKVRQGIPLIVYSCSWNSSGTYFNAFPSQLLATHYDTSYPNQIELLITGGVGFRWTANGVVYFE